MDSTTEVDLDFDGTTETTKPNGGVSSLSFSDLTLLLLVEKLVLDYVVGEFGIRLHSHLLQYPRPVGADGAIAQREQDGNLADRFS